MRLYLLIATVAALPSLAAAQPGLPRVALPLMGFGAPRSLLCGRIAGSSGFPAPATASDFHPGPRGLSPSAVHPIFR